MQPADCQTLEGLAFRLRDTMVGMMCCPPDTKYHETAVEQAREALMAYENYYMDLTGFRTITQIFDPEGNRIG